MGTNYLYDACNGDLSGIVQKLLDLLGGCPVCAARGALAWRGSNRSSTRLNADYEASQRAYADNVDAVMCSNNYSGLVSVVTPIFNVGGSLIPHHSRENDGIIEFQSCAKGLPKDLFNASSNSKLYVTELNHLDTTFRFRDSLFSDTKRPVKWFECLL